MTEASGGGTSPPPPPGAAIVPNAKSSASGVAAPAAGAAATNNAPEMPSWLFKLIEFAVNPLNDRLLSTFSIVSSIMLTIVSFTTTYTGVKVYFQDWYYAAMAALAIQALLFSNSWKIGSALASKFFSSILLGIYLITMSVSVFFSYVAFFGTFYPKEKRAIVAAKILRSSAKQKTNEKLLNLSQKVEDSHKEAANDIQTWSAKVLADLSYLKAIASLNTNTGEEAVKALSDKADDEENIGGTETKSSTGRGKHWDGIIKKRNEKRIEAAQNRGAKKTFTDTYDSLNNKIAQLNSFLSGTSKDLPSASELQSDCSELKALATTSNLARNWTPSADCNDASRYGPLLSDSSIRGRLLASAKSECDTAIKNSESESENSKIQENYSKCWTLMNECANSIKEKEFSSKWQDDLAKNLEWTSADQHEYIQAVGYLVVYTHPMAIGSLILAFIIDLLVLLCAFMGARPRSHLDLRKPSDLYGVEEEAILTSIYYADWSGGTDNPFAKQIEAIRREIQFDPELAKEGFAGYIEIDPKRRLTDSENGSAANPNPPQRITYMMSLLIAMELASVRKHKALDGGEVTIIALRVRLMLWLADLIANQNQAKQIGHVGRRLMNELINISNHLNRNNSN